MTKLIWAVIVLSSILVACSPHLSYLHREPSPLSTPVTTVSPFSQPPEYSDPLDTHAENADLPSWRELSGLDVDDEDSAVTTDEEAATLLSATVEQKPEQIEKAPMEIGEREKEISFDIPIVVNHRVEYFVDYFQNKHRKDFARWLKRSGKYIPMMKDILKEAGLPEDLVYLAMIESGFNPCAYSRRRASGPWQFIYGTGKKYGLVVNWWIDERRNPEKSTVAAARYLKDLYDQFSCWYLAAAGYNAGAGKISRAIRRYRTEDFWELARHRYLRRETKNYVPKMIAAALIAKEPEKYGFTDIEYDEPIRYDKVEITDATDLRVIAQCCDTDPKTIKTLNPELTRWCTPPNYAGYQIKMPLGTKEVFLENFSKLDPSERITFRRHQVRTGETLSHIARRYRTGTKPIMEVNRIRNPRHVRAGSYIIIPIPADRGPSPKTPEKRRSLAVAGVAEKKWDEESFQKVLYVVKKGDTLWKISRTYDLTIEDIKRWNRLRGNLIHPDDTLLLRIKKEQAS